MWQSMSTYPPSGIDTKSATKETAMKAHVQGWGRKAGTVTWLSGALFAFMATNDDNGCATSLPESGVEAECQVASDCKGDPGIDCTGAWACEAGLCAFECGQTRVETGCYDDSDCSGGLVCNAKDVCNAPPGCGPNDNCSAVCYGECVRPEPAPAKCSDSGQCPVGEYCTTDSGACDSNCPPGQVCPAMCWGDCKPRENGGICYDDSQCQFGQFCDRDPCVMPDASGAADRIACGGVCADKLGCGGPQDCAPGEVCGCAPYMGDVPSEDSMPCFQQCQPSEGACAADADCKVGQVCQNGMCVEMQRTCNANSECPAGWLCQSTCDAGGSGATPDGDFAAPPCESVCVPQGGTCADTGTMCLPGEMCVNECTVMCPDCACAAGEACDCGPCTEDCHPACVPSHGGCDPAQCPAGTHCDCPDMGMTPANGLVYCEEKCVEDQPVVECWADADCAAGQYCAPSDCALPPPCDDASGESCDARPAPGCAGTCQVKAAEYDCKSEDSCISPDGRQGFCQFEMCEAFARPCNPDDPNCGAPPPVCYGYCVYDSPVSCDPNADTCPDGTHCADVGCGGSSADPGFMPCLLDYQCVPDATQCVDDCGCDPSLACNEGVCQRMGRMNMCQNRCDTDCDCPDDLACGDGVCRVMNRLNECGLDGCTSDDQCAAGEFCKIDYSQPVCDCMGCPCSFPRGTCVLKEEIRTCNVDTDCGDGEYCGCGQDPTCPMCDICLFQCMPKPSDGSCDTDSDCATGQQCTFYYPPCAQPDPDSGFAPQPCEPIGVCEEAKCRVQGCSGTICSDAPDIVTTCEWTDYYECYRYAICDYNADGVCGWQKTDDYVSCMQRYNP